jgi:hypothetical protein
MRERVRLCRRCNHRRARLAPNAAKPSVAPGLCLSITINDDVKGVIKTRIFEFREPIAPQRKAGKTIGYRCRPCVVVSSMTTCSCDCGSGTATDKLSVTREGAEQVDRESDIRVG